MLTDISTAIIVVSSILSFIGMLTVGLRVLARGATSQNLKWDDYLIIAALLVTVAGSASYSAGAAIGGIGLHIAELKTSTVIVFLKFIFFLQLAYLPAVTLIKLSILLFYKRIFVTPRFGLAIKIMCTIVILWFITFFLATLLQSIPISGEWSIDRSATGRSINSYDMYISAAVLEIVLDLVTLVLPLFVIWKLQMSSIRKWQVSAIFLLGSFVCVASVLRLYYLILHVNPSVEEEEDLTYNLGYIILWSSTEPCVGVICACLPTLGPVFRRSTYQSLAHSLRGLFTYRSEGTSQSPSLSTSNKSPTRSKLSSSWTRAVYPMDDQQSLVTNIRPGVPSGKREAALPLERIVVDNRLENTVERRMG